MIEPESLVPPLPHPLTGDRDAWVLSLLAALEADWRAAAAHYAGVGWDVEAIHEMIRGCGASLGRRIAGRAGLTADTWAAGEVPWGP